MAPLALQIPCVSGGLFFSIGHQSACLKKSRGSGGRAPRTRSHAAAQLLSAPSSCASLRCALFFFAFIDSFFHHRATRSYADMAARCRDSGGWPTVQKRSRRGCRSATGAVAAPPPARLPRRCRSCFGISRNPTPVRSRPQSQTTAVPRPVWQPSALSDKHNDRGSNASGCRRAAFGVLFGRRLVADALSLRPGRPIRRWT